MATKLTTGNVNIIEQKILDDIDYWGSEAKDAEKSLVYIAGVRDMANEVRKVIRALGGV